MNPFFSSDDITFFNMDCLDFLKEQKDDSINFVLTSPPYDNIRDYKGYTFEFEKIATELWRVINVGGVIVWNVADATIAGSETGTSMRQALFFMSLGFRLHDTMIYSKKNPLPSNVFNKRYHQAWEYLFVFSKDTPSVFNPLMVKAKYGHLDANTKHRGTTGDLNYQKTKRNEYTKVRNIFEYSIGGGQSSTDKIAYNHPAIMPEQLASDMISSWTNKGDVVFDPFLGSGTTAKMSKLLHRKFIGTEISKDYCEIAKQRVLNSSVSDTNTETEPVDSENNNIVFNSLFEIE